jgi:hypothetical protein
MVTLTAALRAGPNLDLIEWYLRACGDGCHFGECGLFQQSRKHVYPIVGEDGHFMYCNYRHLRRSYVRDHATYLDQIFMPATGR